MSEQPVVTLAIKEDAYHYSVGQVVRRHPLRGWMRAWEWFRVRLLRRRPRGSVVTAVDPETGTITLDTLL